jgi:hypothetical protein
MKKHKRYIVLLNVSVFVPIRSPHHQHLSPTSHRINTLSLSICVAAFTPTSHRINTLSHSICDTTITSPISFAKRLVVVETTPDSHRTHKGLTPTSPHQHTLSYQQHYMSPPQTSINTPRRHPAAWRQLLTPPPHIMPQEEGRTTSSPSTVQQQSVGTRSGGVPGGRTMDHHTVNLPRRPGVTNSAKGDI